ncbi:unnamed protein product [Durusdinium trenchii]|uniref:Endoplasmic reticulum vesicle transporter C-terminal domain-containing protein n=1 Tax=Durusdinium trenchii TaxID=1381693 RepID=A0ABP0J7I9_9DINO
MECGFVELSRFCEIECPRSTYPIWFSVSHTTINIWARFLHGALPPFRGTQWMHQCHRGMWERTRSICRQVRDGKHVHEFNLKDVSDGFNTSHIIHRLEFGERVPGVESPLEGTAKIVLKGAYMFHYYIKLVPTLFESGDGRPQYTHQYSVTGQEKDVLVRQGELAGLPGVFLVYEFTPFMVQKTVKEVPFSHFLISVCAIIGGVFTVAGLLDAVLYRTTRRLKGKAQI